MPSTKLTKQRWKDHFYYGKWIYIVLACAALFVTDLLYTTTAYRPPNERKVSIQLVNAYASTADDNEEEMSGILARVAERDETLEEVSMYVINYSGDESDYYGYQKFFVELAAGDNDIYISSKMIISSIVAQGASLPLDDYIASGVFTPPEGAELYYQREPVYDTDGNDTGTGEMKIYGVSTAPMTLMPEKAYMDNAENYFTLSAMSANPEASLMVMQDLYELWSQPAEPAEPAE